MATTMIEIPVSYTAVTSDATPQVLLHHVPDGFNNEDCWGHWTVRCTARKVGTAVLAHFYQRVSGIWTAGGGMVLTGTQPAMESEKSVTLSAATMSVYGSGDDLAIEITGIAATNINWFLTVVSHNIYAEN